MNGRLAQLVARSLDMGEVAGSSPAVTTIYEDAVLNPRLRGPSGLLLGRPSGLRLIKNL